MFEQIIGDAVQVKLDAVAPRDVAPPIADGCVEIIGNCLDEHGLAFFVQGQAVAHFVELDLFDFSRREEADNGFVCPDAILFDEVKNKRWLVVVVGVNKADVGIESREQTGAFNDAVEHAVGVIEQAVEGVLSRVAAAPFKAVMDG